MGGLGVEFQANPGGKWAGGSLARATRATRACGDAACGSAWAPLNPFQFLALNCFAWALATNHKLSRANLKTGSQPVPGLREPPDGQLSHEPHAIRLPLWLSPVMATSTLLLVSRLSSVGLSVSAQTH